MIIDPKVSELWESDANSTTDKKSKVRVLGIAPLTWSPEALWNLRNGIWLAWANDIAAHLCGYTLSMLANNWTRGAASRQSTPQSATQGLQPVAHKLLLTAPNHGGMARLSWPEWPVNKCTNTHTTLLTRIKAKIHYTSFPVASQ